MKKLLRVLGIVVLSIIVILLAIIAYIKIALPNVGSAPDIAVAKTPEQVQRGAYLANGVFACMDCHSRRSIGYFSMPLIDSTLGEGGDRYDQSMGLPGVFYASNITPGGIGNWTDGEVYRAITTGVRKNGHPIFPLMPYHGYGYADPEDVKSIIAYLRQLKPIQNAVPASSADFPMSIILNTIPKKAEPMSLPPASDTLARGKYLFTVASCHDCHTPYDKGKFTESLAMAGGRAFPVPGGVVTSANITTDKTTGIGSWNRELFMQRFTMYRDSANAHRPAPLGTMQTVMPWVMYGSMTDADLSSLYAYVRTIAPIENRVPGFKAER